MGSLVQKAHSRAVPWRMSLGVVSSGGASDPADCTYTLRLWSDRFGESWPWVDDLGFFAHVPDHAYEATSADDPTVVSFVPSGDGGVLSISLPAADLSRLIPGAYSGHVVAADSEDATDAVELALFKTVFR